MLWKSNTVTSGRLENGKLDTERRCSFSNFDFKKQNEQNLKRKLHSQSESPVGHVATSDSGCNTGTVTKRFFLTAAAGPGSVEK